ncbi:MAG TPA: protein kinase [Kofleriaceae bacterium]
MQLGRYQILKQLATGDVADVLLARATGLEGFTRHVVIKCIRRELAGEQRLVESFIEEARIAASLHHQNVVQVHDIGEQDGAYFFAMEYVHGEDVRQLLARVREREQQVPLEHVIAIITATAAGLHHAHEQRNPAGEHLGLVHRDVCPPNILLGYDGSVKLVDFGMAKAALRSQKTASGSLKGKASYMSPEQCMGKPVDRRTDTFALGIVLYELATARRLFKGANEFLTMAAIVEGAVPPPSTYRPELPRSFDEIALRALSREPEARYQTAEDLRAALERFAIDQEIRASNKALADYVTSLFGQRLEPWHEDSEVRAAAADFDNTAGKGLVAAPEVDAELIAKHASDSTAPIMLAQSIVDRPEPSPPPSVDDEWSDDEAHIATTARKPSAQVMAIIRPRQETSPTQNERPSAVQLAQLAQLAAAAKSDDDDPYGRTIVTPPVFVDEESTLARDEKAEEAAAVLGHGGGEEEDEAERTLKGTEGVAARTTPLPGVGDAGPRPRDPTPDELPPRPPSEALYVGPPAPRKPLLDGFFGTYQRSIAIGAGAGILAVAIAVLAARSCRRQPVGAPSDAAAVEPNDANAVEPSAPPDIAPSQPKAGKKPPASKPTGSGSAR